MVEEQEEAGDEEEATAAARRSWADVHPAAKPFVAAWRAIRDWWGELLVLAVTCFAWLVLALTVVGAPPATAALYAMARATALHEHPDVRLFLAGLRVYFGKSWALGAIGLSGVLFWLVDLLLYMAMAQDFGGLAWFGAVFIAYFGLVWAQTLFYAWPMMVCRDDLRVVDLLRNGVILSMRYPLHNFVTTLFAALLLAITILYIPPLIALATPALLALLGLHNFYLLAPELVPEDIATLEIVG